MRTAILFLLLTVSCAAPAREAAALSGERLRVASDLDNPPFAWVTSSGEYEGRDVEMMRQLAATLGVELEWIRLPFEELLEAIQEGRAEVVCATLGVTEERGRVVDFTNPYFETSIAVVIRSGFGTGPELARRLTGLRVRAAKGTTSELAVRTHLPGSVLTSGLKGDRSAAEMLQDGEVDALVMDAPAARKLIASSRGRFELASETLAPEHYALAVGRKGVDGLVERLNAALEERAREGAWSDLNRRFELDQVEWAADQN